MNDQRNPAVPRLVTWLRGTRRYDLGLVFSLRQRWRFQAAVMLIDFVTLANSWLASQETRGVRVPYAK
jgi:hypothetical protein